MILPPLFYSDLSLSQLLSLRDLLSNYSTSSVVFCYLGTSACFSLPQAHILSGLLFLWAYILLCFER